RWRPGHRRALLGTRHRHPWRPCQPLRQLARHMIRRRPTQIFSLAFLDCICCGFGAIILLFVLTVDKQDKATLEARDKLKAMAASYAASLAEMQQRKGDLERGSNDAAKLVLDA